MTDLVDDFGWSLWEPRAAPLAGAIRVEVLFESGQTAIGPVACFHWLEPGNAGWIRRYRVVGKTDDQAQG